MNPPPFLLAVDVISEDLKGLLATLRQQTSDQHFGPAIFSLHSIPRFLKGETLSRTVLFMGLCSIELRKHVREFSFSCLGGNHWLDSLFCLCRPSSRALILKSGTFGAVRWLCRRFFPFWSGRRTCGMTSFARRRDSKRLTTNYMLSWRGSSPFFSSPYPVMAATIPSNPRTFKSTSDPM